MSVNAAALDRYIERESVLHSADPRIKTGLTFLFVVALTSLPVAAWPFIGGFLAAIWAATLLSGIHPVRILKRTFIALPFILVAAPSVFTRGGETLAVWDAGIVTLTPTREGLEFVLTIMAKSWLAVTAAALLAATTRYLDVIAALRWYRVPALLVAVMAMMYRYLFLLVEEAQRLITARRSRSAAIDGYKSGGTVRWRAKVAGNMAGSLFVRTLDRSERVHMAMLARGFDGTAPAQSLGRVHVLDALAFVVLLTALVATAAAARLV